MIPEMTVLSSVLNKKFNPWPIKRGWGEGAQRVRKTKQTGCHLNEEAAELHGTWAILSPNYKQELCHTAVFFLVNLQG